MGHFHLVPAQATGRRSRRAAGRMTGTLVSVLLALASATNAAAADAQPVVRAESETAEPGLQYGHRDALRLPKTIFFGAGVDNILSDAKEWSRRGVTAFFVDYVAREWSTDIWAKDGKPWTIGDCDATLQQARMAASLCRQIGSETFLKIAFDHPFEWFNDIAWQKIDNNFRQFAIFAREAGFDGVALDIEYVHQQYTFDWEGYTYDGYTRTDLVRKIDQRMTRVAQILYDEFPQMVLLTFPEQGLSLGAIIHRAWIEEAARRAAPGGVHYCTEWTYRHSNIRYVFGHIWACHELFHRILSDRGWQYWREKCSIAAGIWPFSSDDYRLYGPGIPLAELRQGFAATLMVSPRYNWIYGSYTQEQLIGRQLEKYTGTEDIHAHLDALSARQIVIDDKWIELARQLREAVLRDYSADLGVVPVPLFVGPDDVVRVELAAVGPSLSSPAHPRCKAAWELGLRIFRGEEINLQQHLHTITDWMLLGPFPNDERFRGHATAYAPEQSLDLAADYEGLPGSRIRWVAHHQADNRASVDLRKILHPSERVCAYALCYVTCPEQRDVLIGIGTNDSGKMWVDGQLVYDHPHEGRAILDRNLVSVTLPQGTTPILLKICNGELDWGFVLRILDQHGQPATGLTIGLRPD